MSATKCPRCNTPGITFQGVGDTDDVELKCYACNHTSGPVSNYGAAVARFYATDYAALNKQKQDAFLKYGPIDTKENK